MSKESKAKPREFWILDDQLQFGPSISSDPKDHATLVAVFRIPIKSNAVHLVEYSAYEAERAKSARLLEALKENSEHMEALLPDVQHWYENKCCPTEGELHQFMLLNHSLKKIVDDYNQSEGGD